MDETEFHVQVPAEAAVWVESIQYIHQVPLMVEMELLVHKTLDLEHVVIEP